MRVAGRVAGLAMAMVAASWSAEAVLADETPKAGFGVHGDLVAEHGVTDGPRGTVDGRYDAASRVLTYEIRYAQLSGPVTDASLRGPKPDGGDEAVKPIEGPYDGPIRGRLALSPSQATVLERDELFVRLDTARFPKGEARAQLDARADGEPAPVRMK